MFQEQILTVTRLVELLREVVEDNFLEIAVEGEVSNYAAPASGHVYFTLKDSHAQIRSVMFRQYNRLLKFTPENGMQVICRGRLSVYPQRGELQMIVEHLELQGEGGLQAAYDELKKRLDKEGLFDPQRKRSLPVYPRTVGVITSATGAAIRDILQVLRRRAAGVRVNVCPVRVQGDDAAKEVIQAIELMNRHNAADVLIVGRGGGSLEDLWAFNDEALARTIFASRIPVISAVGHEVDYTIADYVADQRAPTPSAAAEIVSRSCQEIETHIDHLSLRLNQAMQHKLTRDVDRLSALGTRLRSPGQRVNDLQKRLADLRERMSLNIRNTLEKKGASLLVALGRLEAYSPQHTLERGYSIVTRGDDRSVVAQADDTESGEHLKIRFAKGSALVTVDKVTR